MPTLLLEELVALLEAEVTQLKHQIQKPVVPDRLTLRTASQTGSQ